MGCTSPYRLAAVALLALVVACPVLAVPKAGNVPPIAFGVNGIPHMVIIGRDGRILNIYRGYDERNLDDIVADINKALAVPR